MFGDLRRAELEEEAKEDMSDVDMLLDVSVVRAASSEVVSVIG